MRFLPLIILAWPLVEIAGFIAVGKAIGLFPTLLAVVATSVLGVALLRAQGVAVLMDASRVMRTGGRPETAFAHAALVALGGFLLIVPGFASDVVGIALFVPIIRSGLIRWLARALGPSVVVRSRVDIVDLDPEDWHESASVDITPRRLPRRDDDRTG